MLFTTLYQMLGKFYGHILVRDIPDEPMLGAAEDMLSVSDDWEVVSFPFPNHGPRIRHSVFSVKDLSAILDMSTPIEQYHLLGDHLIPLVDELEHEKAPKITGMLLELAHAEILHLLASSDALKARVAEAMDLLRSDQSANNSAKQLDSHSSDAGSRMW